MGPALTAANIRYLLAIEDLDRDGKGVRCVDVAQALGITKPSVHSMVDSMKDMGLLEKPHYGVIQLTDLGRSTADQYQVYFQTICRHFTQFLPQRQDHRKWSKEEELHYIHLHLDEFMLAFGRR